MSDRGESAGRRAASPISGTRPPTREENALAASRHGRLATEQGPPSGTIDPESARRLCAQICRDLLSDYAPALALLGAHDRRRIQALAAYARTLFDFALDRGFGGERLARINRWEFELEHALAGEAPAQPVFLAMATAARDRPWSSSALRDLATIARRFAARGPEAATGPAAEMLATALLAAALGRKPADDAVASLAAIIASEIGVSRGAQPTPPSTDLSPRWRRALRYAALAVGKRHPGGGRRQPLGLTTRLLLLARCRLGA